MSKIKIVAVVMMTCVLAVAGCSRASKHEAGAGSGFVPDTARAAMAAAHRVLPVPAAAHAGVVEAIGAAATEAAARVAGATPPPEGN